MGQCLNAGLRSFLGRRQFLLRTRQSFLRTRQSLLGLRQSFLGVRQSLLGVRQSLLGLRQFLDALVVFREYPHALLDELRNPSQPDVRLGLSFQDELDGSFDIHGRKDNTTSRTGPPMAYRFVLDRTSDLRCFRSNSGSLDFNESNAGVLVTP